MNLMVKGNFLCTYQKLILMLLYESSQFQANINENVISETY